MQGLIVIFIVDVTENVFVTALMLYVELNVLLILLVAVMGYALVILVSVVVMVNVLVR